MRDRNHFFSSTRPTYLSPHTWFSRPTRIRRCISRIEWPRRFYRLPRPRQDTRSAPDDTIVPKSTLVQSCTPHNFPSRDPHNQALLRASRCRRSIYSSHKKRPPPLRIKNIRCRTPRKPWFRFSDRNVGTAGHVGTCRRSFRSGSRKNV